MDCTIPTVSNWIIIEDEPKLMNGSGIPVIGIMPMHMPMFSKVWNAHMPTMPTHDRRKNSDSHLKATRIVEKISST